jgi:acyl carrier protein
MSQDMERNQIEQAVLGVLQTILRRELAAGTSVSRLNTPARDSLTHIEIMFALEDEFGIEFSEAELNSLDSVARIVDALKKSHAA